MCGMRRFFFRKSVQGPGWCRHHMAMSMRSRSMTAILKALAVSHYAARAVAPPELTVWQVLQVRIDVVRRHLADLDQECALASATC